MPWDGVVARLFDLYAQKQLQQATMWTGCENTAHGIRNDIQTRSLWNCSTRNKSR